MIGLCDYITSNFFEIEATLVLLWAPMASAERATEFALKPHNPSLLVTAETPVSPCRFRRLCLLLSRGYRS